MDKITQQVYIGNFLDSQNTDAIKEEGIDVVLNVAKEIPLKVYKSIQSEKVGLINANTPENKKNLIDVISKLKRFILLGKKVLVHCYAGKNRSAFVIAKALADINNTDWKKEFAKIKQKHPIANILPWMEEI